MTTTDPAPASHPSGYVLGVNDAELERLGLQHQLWASRTAALWERADIRPGMRVLDIGCGPGFASFDLARLVGAEGRVVAIDEAQMYMERLREQAAARRVSNLEAHQGDVQRLADALAGQALFDAAYARWVLCFVPDPGAVVRAAASVLAPGGRLVVQDYFNYQAFSLAPRSPLFDRVIASVRRAWVDRGGDPDIGGRLPGFMRAAGLDVVEITPQLRVARPGTHLWAWPDSFFRNFLPELERAGYLPPDERRAFEAEWAARGRDPDTFLYTPPLVEIIAVKR